MIRVQSDCLLTWRNAIESAFVNIIALIRRASCPRWARRLTANSGPVSRRQTVALEELEKGKDVDSGLSIDSTASSESDDTRPPRVPVLLIDQLPNGNQRSGGVVDRKGADDLDFLTALRTS